MACYRMHRPFFAAPCYHHLFKNHRIQLSFMQQHHHYLGQNFVHSSANGPVTTLPAALDSPIRKPGQAAISHYYRVGKAYLQFYRTGIKNIYYNYKASRPIKNLIKSKYGGVVALAIKENAISRSDFQLLTRSWHDIKRVPLFGLVFAFFGELTPFIVIFIGNIVPLTCRIPGHIRKERLSLEERRREAYSKDSVVLPVNKGITGLKLNELRQIDANLGLTTRVWNFFGWPPTILLKRRIQARLDYLKLDDTLIETAGGVQEMDVEEVRMALVERGVDVLGREESHLRYDLQSWLRLRNEVSYENLLLIRLAEWLTKK